MNKELFFTLLNKVVKVDRGGPESNVGLLLEATDDHITVLTENDGVLYYQMQHIKSLTHNAKEALTLDIVVPENFEFLKAENFNSVLSNLRYQWISVNRGGPEKLEGVLEDVGKDYITIILNEEIIRLSLFHIRSISYGLKVEKEKENENENEKGKENGKNAEAKKESN